ncbi:MAG TPA: hypothetical protein VGK58_07070 [Lacipirellulaceae bacterium]
MDDTPKFRRPHFSLKALLIIMALVAAFIGAYVIGYQRGYEAAKAESRANYVIWDKP